MPVDVTTLPTHLMDAADRAGVQCWTVAVRVINDTVSEVTWHTYGHGQIAVVAETTYPTLAFGLDVLTRALLERVK